MAAYMSFSHSLQDIAIMNSTTCSAHQAGICALQDMTRFVLRLNGCGMQVSGAHLPQLVSFLYMVAVGVHVGQDGPLLGTVAGIQNVVRCEEHVV